MKTQTKKNLSLGGYNFWNNIYHLYYWTPKAPVFPKPVPVTHNQKPSSGDLKADKPNTETKSTETKPANTKTAEEQKSPVSTDQKYQNQGAKIDPDNPKKETKTDDKKTDKPKT